MKISELIKKRRIELHLSQQELAALLGYKTRSSIAKIEKGACSIPYSKLSSLANILNTTVEKLISGSEDQNNTLNYDNASFHDILSDNQVTRNTINGQKVIAIVLAGGQYRTDKHKTPYQFVSVQGKPIIIYTLDKYQKHPAIDDIYVVCPDGWDAVILAYAKQFKIDKLKRIIPAGNTGVKSVKNSINSISRMYEGKDIILLQEATRPMITFDIISNSIRCCKLNGSSITYTSLNNTTPFLINKTTDSITPINAYDLITVQSPEAYTLDYLQDAFLEADKINHELSEAVCVNFMYNLGKKLTFCEGSTSNIRIIDEENLLLFQSLVNSN